LSIAPRRESKVVRYGEVALLASARSDQLLVTSLNELYLAPLEAERDGGAVLRETLRAYFAAERNISAAASKLGVTRQTVKNRIQVAEERIGTSLSGISTDMKIALLLDALKAQDRDRQHTLNISSNRRASV
jgi:DNA-binding PucR family transcriptional regulator